jgi:RNA polymerase sigma-70 factor (ECF subfamily)
LSYSGRTILGSRNAKFPKSGPVVTDSPVPDDRGGTSSSLLERIRANEPDAWGRFVRLYGPLVAGWCRSAGLQAADTEDVAQDVFREAIGRVAALSHGPGESLRGWLRTVTRSKIANWYRDRAVGGNGFGGDGHPGLAAATVSAPLPDDESGSTPADDPGEELVLLRQAVEMVLEEFEPATRRAYLRVVLDQQSPGDVARELGLSVNAAYLARSRVKRRLREEFEGSIEL